MSKDRNIRESLSETLDESEWKWLAPHLVRDSVILVANGLDLLTVAEKVALDDQEQVSLWVSQGLLSKPTKEQIEAWTRLPEKKFMTVIVQPFVLAQEHLLH